MKIIIVIVIHVHEAFLNIFQGTSESDTALTARVAFLHYGTNALTTGANHKVGIEDTA